MRATTMVPLMCFGVLLAGCAESPLEECETMWPPSVSGWVWDQDSRPVRGASLQLRRPDGYSETTLSGGGQEGGTHFLFFAVGSGDFTLTITPPTGYAVPAKQPNPIRFTIRGACENASAHHTIVLHRE